MQHLDRARPAPPERPPDLSEINYRGPGLYPPDGASMRMVAAMAEPSLPAEGPLLEDVGAADRLTPFAGDGVENDAQYYLRRSKEECRAAGDAAVPEARAAHQELADRYARLSRRAMRHRVHPSSYSQSVSGAQIARMLRQRFGVSAGWPGAAPRSARVSTYSRQLRQGRSRPVWPQALIGTGRSLTGYS